VERRGLPLPPPPLLATSAPRLAFSEFLWFEDRTAPAVLALGLSDNPFVGLDLISLDTRMRGNSGEMVNYLFFFFFPPPPSCLAQLKFRFDEAERRQQEERLRAAREAEKDKPLPPPAPIRVEQDCRFAATPMDLFAEQISRRVVMHSAGNHVHVSAATGEFYFPPVEQTEFAGHTFFVFEAERQQTIDTSEIQRYSLPEELRGTRAHYFWAIGAESPFPFVHDPLRKEVPLVHLAYACLSASGDARNQFLSLLRNLHFRP
jgi:PAS domain-containing protein